MLGFTSSKKQTEEKASLKTEEKVQHFSRKDAINKTKHSNNLELNQSKTNVKEEKENCHKIVPEKSSKKIKLLGKYLHVHKKLFIPLPGLFSRNRLYKAQSCSSLQRDKINLNPEITLRNRQRAISVVRHSIGSNDDINCNTGMKGIKDICTVHLGQASKCSFC